MSNLPNSMDQLNCFVKVLNALCANDPGLYKFRIFPSKWKEIYHLLAFFRPFAEVTVEMSGQKYPTMSGVIVYFNFILDHLDRYKEDLDIPLKIRTAAEEAHTKMVEYYNKTNTLNCIITLLDPRCNVEYFMENGFDFELRAPFMTR